MSPTVQFHLSPDTVEKASGKNIQNRPPQRIEKREEGAIEERRLSVFALADQRSVNASEP